LQELTANPGMDGTTLTASIVNSYIQEDQRIVDDNARAEFLSQSSPLGGFFGSLGGMSAQQLTQQLYRTATLAAIDLDQVRPW
jgi:hypothetical protein